MEFLGESVKQLSKKLTEKAIASNHNLRLRREINLHIFLLSGGAGFYGFNCFEYFDNNRAFESNS